MQPFNLQKGCSSVPWQGEFVSLAVRLNGMYYKIQQITEKEMIELRGAAPDDDDVWGLPVVASFYNDLLTLYPTPDDSYSVVECA